MDNRNEFAEEVRDIRGRICSACGHFLILRIEKLPDTPVEHPREKVDSVSKEGSHYHP